MSINPFHLQHERRFAGNRFVYPVISRRSRGVSIGVNLNPDKACNFHCVYCQVDRTVAGDTQFVDVERLLAELDQTLTLAVSGRLFETDKFRNLPSTLRRLNDIAFSGDGEPTTHRNFDEILAACAEVKRRHGLDDVKMVLITNASRFHRPHVSEVWRSWTGTKAKSGPNSTRGRRITFVPSTARPSLWLACWRTSPRPPAFGPWSSSRCG